MRAQIYCNIYINDLVTLVLLENVSLQSSPLSVQHKSHPNTPRYVGPHRSVSALAQTVDGLHLGLQPVDRIGYLLSQL